MSIWTATVALRSESDHQFFFSLDPAEHFKIQMAPVKVRYIIAFDFDIKILLKWEISQWPNCTKMGNQSMAKCY